MFTAAQIKGFPATCGFAHVILRDVRSRPTFNLVRQGEKNHLWQWNTPCLELRGGPGVTQWWNQQYNQAIWSKHSAQVSAVVVLYGLIALKVAGRRKKKITVFRHMAFHWICVLVLKHLVRMGKSSSTTLCCDTVREKKNSLFKNINSTFWNYEILIHNRTSWAPSRFHFFVSWGKNPLVVNLLLSSTQFKTRRCWSFIRNLLETIVSLSVCCCEKVQQETL